MASDIERAWHVFALNPAALSRRTYQSHLEAYRVDQRIAGMQRDSTWPPPVDLRARWPDFDSLLDVIGDNEPYALTLHDERIVIARRPLALPTT